MQFPIILTERLQLNQQTLMPMKGPAYDYGAYVGNAGVAGTARAFGEIGQSIGYGIETISRGKIDLLPGSYNPFNKEYLLDSIQDINNTIDGANGNDYCY